MSVAPNVFFDMVGTTSMGTLGLDCTKGGYVRKEGGDSERRV